MHTETLIKLNNNEVSNITKFHWDCYGKNAFYMDLRHTNKNGVCEEFVIVYDCTTNKVFDASYYNNNGTAFKWYSPEKRQNFMDECFLKSCDPKQCTAELNWVEMNQTDFLLSLEKVLRNDFSNIPKAEKRNLEVVSTLDDDWNKSEIEFNLSKDELEALKTIAIENELTINQLVTQILEVQLAERKT